MNGTFRQPPPKVFAAGGAHQDRRGRCFEPFHPGASNPGVMAESVGGAVLNAVRAMRRFGAAVSVVSARGGDRSGAAVAAALAEIGVADMSMTWLDRRTPTYTAILEASGDLVGGLADMALYELMRPRVFSRRHIREAMDDSDFMLLDANLPADTIERLAVSAGKRPVAAIGVSPAKVGRLAAAIPRFSMLFLSLAEATALVDGTADLPAENVVARLAETGCRQAVVTDGPRPAAIVADGTICWQAPPIVASLRDVTGAGDTLAGAATFAVATGAPFLAAARFGMVAASLHVSAERSTGDFTVETTEAAARALPDPLERRPAGEG